MARPFRGKAREAGMRPNRRRKLLNTRALSRRTERTLVTAWVKAG